MRREALIYRFFSTRPLEKHQCDHLHGLVLFHTFELNKDGLKSFSVSGAWKILQSELTLLRKNPKHPLVFIALHIIIKMSSKVKT